MGGPRSTSAPWLGLLHTATAGLAARLGSTTPQVSRTVRQLREAGLVRSERDGKLSATAWPQTYSGAWATTSWPQPCGNSRSSIPNYQRHRAALVSQPWREAGRAQLTTRAVEERLDACVTALLDALG